MDSYIDIEAVSRLLEERERDLELAAHIGQSLLEKNRCLKEKNDQLEELISQDNEHINQLRHDLNVKDELLQLYLQNYDNTDASSTDNTDGLHISALQKKISILEEENLHLLLETGNLKSIIDGWDDKEQKLIQQLDDLRKQLAQCSKELAEKMEKYSQQEDENANLQKHIRTLTAENLEYHKTLEEACDSWDYLIREIADLKEKNEEIFMHLEETEDELHNFRNNERRTRAMSHSSYMPSSSFHSVQGDSLATELEISLRSDIDYPKGYSPSKHTQKIFETARAARAAYKRHASFCGAGLLGTSGFEIEDLQSVSQRNSMCLSDAESVVNDGYIGDVESLYGGLNNRLGRPGIPGLSDFPTEPSQLTQRQVCELNELDYGEKVKVRQELESNERARTVSEATDISDTESVTSKQCPSLESTFSGNSGYVSMAGSLGNHYRMPDRLKIIKPLEGSLSLLRWQKLATPTIGVILESSPGVHSRGEKFDFVTGAYNLSDCEEDDGTTFSAQCLDNAMVCTLADSSVIHPTSITVPSLITSTSHMTFGDRHRFRLGTITYSMSLGLASLLNALNTVQSPIQSMYNFNPTQFPDLVSETHYNASESVTSSVLLPVPNDGYQLMPPLLTSQMQGSLSMQVSQNPSKSDQQYAANDGSIAKTSTNESVQSNTVYVINKLMERGSPLFGNLKGDVGVYKAGFTDQLSGRSCALPPTMSASVANISETVTQSHAPRRSYFTSLIIKKSCW